MTPEGKVKAAVNKIIAAYGDRIYKFMPVPGGYGPSSLDYILCVGGLFVAVETKAPGGKMTARQEFTTKQILASGGLVFEIDGANGQLEVFLLWLNGRLGSASNTK